MHRKSFITALLAGLLPALSGPLAVSAFVAQHTLEIRVANSSDSTLECGASLAHWFSKDLGRIAPQQAPHHELTIRFGYDLASGTVYERNETGDEMPVLQLWCGLAGQAWATRSDIPLPRVAGKAPAAQGYDCSVQGAAVTCRAANRGE
ncbi:hypothetical protein HOY34_14280 [Xinfangfangia sp. D13-10-4-6]|uniref:hypothetical protein n=1 Tax=Pseudogemmobacter hezensis TaxID=2737662 RepID=UPI00155557ED|nr:hypothetical protein [Pseudogemmobacter hezensis]NPD16363.1 hypothetical protein [Pseudogemmobacter hezensis]